MTRRRSWTFRELVAKWKQEEYTTQLLPGISTVDCLFADLRIDPGVIGVQMLLISQLLRKETQVASCNHLILLPACSPKQDSDFDEGAFNQRLEKLFDRLITSDMQKAALIGASCI